ncbi:MAG: PIG-L family deacetylase [Planctomycetota bacterium]
MNPSLSLLALLPLALGGCRIADIARTSRAVSADASAPRVLCVVAHPDDETAFAGTIFKISAHLGGTCDLVVITNGEAGYKYSTLAEDIYGLELTDERVGRANLPRIRKAEMRAAGAILRVHEIDFLDQLDHRYTQDEGEVLGRGARVWDLTRVRAHLDARLASGNYDFVFVHLPTPETHGHHKAATLLALEAISRMPPERAPVALAAFHQSKTEARNLPFAIDGHALSEQHSDLGPWSFDRTQTFGHQNKLDYRIVTSWAVAEHKSQGSYQGLLGRGELESFRMFRITPRERSNHVEQLFARLAEPQFPPLEYDAEGRRLKGTN